MAVQEVAGSASYFDGRWPPGSLGVWAVAGILMAVAASLIAVVVYFLPPPPQLEPSSIPRGRAHISTCLLYTSPSPRD